MSAIDLIAAIRLVVAGDVSIPPKILRRLLDRIAHAFPDPVSSPSDPNDDPVSGLNTLTEREREVLIQVARGLSNVEIATMLRVSETTVKTHIGRVLTKLGLRGRVQAVVLAYESGLIRPRM